MSFVSGAMRNVGNRIYEVPGVIKKTAAKTGESIVKTFESLNTAVTQLKGLQAFAKAGRSIEGAMKQIIGGTTGLGAGWANTLKGISATSAALSALNALVTLPEQIKKAREIFQIAHRVLHGDYIDLTLNTALDQFSFWPKKAAEYIECISFVGNNLAFYNLGVAATPLATTKSFADGFSSILGIWHKSLAIMNAKAQSAKAQTNIDKWEGRAKWIKGEPGGWNRQGLDKTISKQILLTHLTFVNEALRLGKEFKIDSKDALLINVQKEEIKTTLFNRKITKIINKASAPAAKPEQDLKQKLKEIEAKLWKSDLTPQSRQAILNILRDKDLTPQGKIEKLERAYSLKYRFVEHDKDSYFGIYNPDDHQVDLLTREIFQRHLDRQSAGATYENVYTDAIKSQERWHSFRNDNLFDDDVQKKALKSFCDGKAAQWKEVKAKQSKIVTKSSISIAFSVGIVALVTLGLTLTFAAKGTLPVLVVKHLPFALAGLGVAVSIIGLIKFFVDELNKDDKPVRKPKIDRYDIFIEPENVTFPDAKRAMQRRKDAIEAARANRLAAGAA